MATPKSLFKSPRMAGKKDVTIDLNNQIFLQYVKKTYGIPGLLSLLNLGTSIESCNSALALLLELEANATNARMGPDFINSLQLKTTQRQFLLISGINKKSPALQRSEIVNAFLIERGRAAYYPVKIKLTSNLDRYSKELSFKKVAIVGK